MRLKSFLGVVAGLVWGASFATANGIVYDCNSSISQNTCNYLNNTVAALYDNTFVNANAVIYVSLASDLGSNESESEYEFNFISYSSYLNRLTTNSGGDAVDVAALDSLNQYATPVYGSGNVAVTGALGQALGITTTAGGGTLDGVVASNTTDPNVCVMGSSGCFAGDVLLSTSDFNSSGATRSYSLATSVEHETDEILGTGSCIGQDGSSECVGYREQDPSAIDLFRYSGAGDLVSEGNIVDTANAYFSYNGGTTNGADGAKYDDTVGLDYADFQGSCQYVQDGIGCTNGTVLNVTTDGPGGTHGPEITELDAIGYNLEEGPEPGTMGLFGASLAVLAVCRRRRA